MYDNQVNQSTIKILGIICDQVNSLGLLARKIVLYNVYYCCVRILRRQVFENINWHLFPKDKD